LLYVADVVVGSQVSNLRNGIVRVFGGHENRGAIKPFLAAKAGQGYEVFFHGILLRLKSD
jgi:hypothetical protein